MNIANDDRILAAHWSWFRRIWIVATFVLLALLLLLAILGFGPGGRNCPLLDCVPGAAALPVPVPEALGDTVAPTLALEGDNPVLLALGTDYQEPGVTALDDVDGVLAVSSAGIVDGRTPGRYTVTYTATDQAGNIATLTRLVIVDAPPGATDDGAVGQTVTAATREATIYFALGSAELPPDALTLMAPVVADMAQYPEASAVISGFHDASGTRASNESLALSRAQSVRNILLEQGIAAERVRLEKPRVTEGTGAPQEARRVEVHVMP